MKTKAAQVQTQIEQAYTYNGRYTVNAIDVMEHLKRDLIDSNEPACHKSSGGFDLSLDESMAVFYYSDNSVLVVGSTVGVKANH